MWTPQGHGTAAFADRGGGAAAGLQLSDVRKAAGVVADMRKVFRQDTRIIQKLHRRVFLDRITNEQVRRTSLRALLCSRSQRYCIRAFLRCIISAAASASHHCTGLISHVAVCWHGKPDSISAWVTPVHAHLALSKHM